MKKRAGECVYCGQPAEDEDHIPPRSMVPESSRANILKVPACKTCNSGRFSRDDEYMMVWSTIEDSKESEDAKLVAEKVGRWKQYPSKRRQLKEYYSSLTPTVFKSVRGKDQPRIKFKMDNRRIVRFTERIITGLFFVEFRKRIPAGYVVKVVPEEDRKTDWIRDQWRSLFDDQPFRTVGRDAMKYRFVAMHKMPNVTVWHIVFFRRIHMYGMTSHAKGGKIMLPGIELKYSISPF